MILEDLHPVWEKHGMELRQYFGDLLYEFREGMIEESQIQAFLQLEMGHLGMDVFTADEYSSLLVQGLL